jgi:hypothetical protein
MLAPTTIAESASLWAIRIAMVLMVIAFAAELRGAKSTHRIVSIVWLLGALFAMGHSLGALWTFHHGSQAAALESTAEQTQQLLGFRFGAGLYINYLFVVVWLFDAMLRSITPTRYVMLPRWYRATLNGFLIFIAINGAIVFKSGWIRAIGIVCVVLLCGLAVVRMRDGQASRAS